MNRIIVQIYEIQTPEEAQNMLDLGVDHIGSVITSLSAWKDPSIRETVRLVHSASAKSSLIPLFSEPEAVFCVIDYYRPDIIHFCDALSDADSTAARLKPLIQLQQNVKKRFPDTQIMRSIPIVEPGSDISLDSLKIAREFEPISDYFLTDTLLAGETDQQPAGDEQPVDGFVGITGKTCNWDTAAALVSESGIPVVLAGGISPQNVLDGIVSVHPFGVDSCTQTNALDRSGEPVRFRKDTDKVRRLMEAVRMAERIIQE